MDFKWYNRPFSKMYRAFWCQLLYESKTVLPLSIFTRWRAVNYSFFFQSFSKRQRCSILHSIWSLIHVYRFSLIKSLFSGKNIEWDEKKTSSTYAFLLYVFFNAFKAFCILGLDLRTLPLQVCMYNFRFYLTLSVYIKVEFNQINLVSNEIQGKFS